LPGRYWRPAEPEEIKPARGVLRQPEQRVDIAVHQVIEIGVVHVHHFALHPMGRTVHHHIDAAEVGGTLLHHLFHGLAITVFGQYQQGVTAPGANGFYSLFAVFCRARGNNQVCPQGTESIGNPSPHAATAAGHQHGLACK